MQVLKEYKFSYTCDLTMEEYIRNVTRCCHASSYNLVLQFRGSSICELYLKPQKKFGVGFYPFKPVISAIVVNEAGSLKIEIVCKPQEENCIFLLVLCIEAVILTVFLLFIYGIGNVYVYYPLVIPALGIPLATWVNRQVSLHVARDILQC